MITNDAQHRISIAVIFRKGTEFFGHLGRGRISYAGHQRGDSAAKRSALFAVIGQAGAHQQAADVSVAKAQGTVVIRALRYLLGGELRH